MSLYEHAERHRTGVAVLLAVWSFLEASFWFIIPDFFLMPAAATQPRNYKRLVLISAFSSLLGGIVFAVFVSFKPELALELLLHVPYVTTNSFAQVASLMGDSPFNILWQPISRIPFKVWIYDAVTIPANLFVFFTLAFLARLVRMSIASWLVQALVLKYPTFVRKHFGKLLVAYILLWTVVFMQL